MLVSVFIVIIIMNNSDKINGLRFPVGLSSLRHALGNERVSLKYAGFLAE